MKNMTNEIVKKRELFEVDLGGGDYEIIDQEQRDGLWKLMINNPQMTHFKINDTIVARNRIGKIKNCSQGLIW